MITVKREIHPIYKDRITASCGGIGKWHYIYTNGNKRLSLIKLIGYMYGKYVWELYGYKLDDVKRFRTKREALQVVKRLLK